MSFVSPILEGHDIHIKLGNRTIISNCSIVLAPHKIHAILGQSGAGKSTLISALAGHKPITSGTIHINGKLMPPSGDLLLPGFKNVQLLTQQNQLNTFATVYDNIASQFSNTNLALKQETTHKLLSVVELKHLAGSKIATLSGGEQQRVALAKAVASQPDILILDEPFNQLDIILAEKLQNALLQINNTIGTTILFVTHNIKEAFALNASVSFLNAGTLSAMQSPHQAYNAPSSPLACQLLFKGYTVAPDLFAALAITPKKHKSHIIINPETAKLIPGSKFIITSAIFYGPVMLYELKPIKIGHLLHIYCQTPFKVGSRVDVVNIQWYEFA